MKKFILITIFLIAFLGAGLWVLELSLRNKMEDAIISSLQPILASEVSVGRILFMPKEGLVLRNLVIKERNTKGPVLKIKRLILGYKLKDVILGKVDTLKSLKIAEGRFLLDEAHPLAYALNGEIAFSDDDIELKNIRAYLMGIPVSLDGRLLSFSPQEEPQAELELGFESGYVDGILDIIGALASPNIKGDINIFDSLDIPIEAKLDVKENGFTFSSIDGSGSIGFREDTEKNGAFKGEIGFRHFGILGRDVVSDITADLKVAERPGGHLPKLDGSVKSTGTVIDFMPADEFEFAFELSEDTFNLLASRLGEHYTLKGSVGLKKPYDMDIRFGLRDVDLEKLAELSDIEDARFVTGILNGDLAIMGPMGSFLVDGSLRAENGNLGYITYEDITVNMKGRSPIIKIVDSRISRHEGVMLLRGYIDLRKIGRDNLFEDLKVLSDKNTIVWEGWDITKRPESPKLSVGKDVGDAFRVNYSAFMEDETEMKKPDNRQNEWSLEYRLRERENIRIRMRENEDAVFLEHKLKF